MTKISQEKNLYKTTDIALCSALCCCGYIIQKIEKQSSGKATFFIERDEKLDGLMQDFFSHKLRVDALGYFNALKEIKTRMYNI